MLFLRHGSPFRPNIRGSLINNQSNINEGSNLPPVLSKKFKCLHRRRKRHFNGTWYSDVFSLCSSTQTLTRDIFLFSAVFPVVFPISFLYGSLRIALFVLHNVSDTISSTSCRPRTPVDSAPRIKLYIAEAALYSLNFQ